MTTEEPAGENQTKRIVRHRPQSGYEGLLRNADPQPDTAVPRIPDDLTSVSEQVLMNAMRQQVEWQNFFATKLVELEMIEADTEQEYETAKAIAYLSNDTKTVTQGKSQAAGDPLVQKKRTEWRTAKANRKAMEVARNSRERSASLLSRELTRRTSGDPNQRRVDRYGGA